MLKAFKTAMLAKECEPYTQRTAEEAMQWKGWATHGAGALSRADVQGASNHDQQHAAT